MRWMSNIWVILILLSSPASAREEMGKDATVELLLFGANWCAPCRAELEELPGLAAVLGGDSLVVAWIDGTPRIEPKTLPANVRVLDRRSAQRLFDSFSTANAGLPLAVLRTATGKVCAVVRRRIRPIELATLRRGCAA